MNRFEAQHTSVAIPAGRTIMHGRLEEPGALDHVGALAARWFNERLRREGNLVA
jgi:hypothetical protein